MSDFLWLYEHIICKNQFHQNLSSIGIFDGTSYWNFWNVWSNIHKNLSASSSYLIYSAHNLPVHNRWFPNGKIISLPFKHPNEFIVRYESPPLREKIFHFSSKCIANLKKKANYNQPKESRPRQGLNESHLFKLYVHLFGE